MQNSNIKTSGFTLAKAKKLVGDDFYDVKTIDNLTIGIVCDGVGSAQEGRAAAKRVVNYLMTNFKNRPQGWSIEKSITKFIISINTILYQESIVNYERPELVTTLAIVIIEGNKLYSANVGDSRVYLLRDEKLTQLSSDHVMEEIGYENVLTQAMGIAPDVTPYYFENIIQKNDKIILCSDGLYNILSEDILQKGILLGANALVKKASNLMENNLPDDTTAVIIEIQKISFTEELKKQNLSIPTSLKVGEEIDGYILEKSLIQNNRTWLCSKKNKQYVLKFVPIEAIEDKILLDLFVQEEWNAKRLKAGFFPKAVIPKKRSARYYVMEALDGVALSTYLKKRLLSVDESINLAKTLLKMGQYLIKFDLVHGDIKPENIMIIVRDDKKFFKIIDFGSITEIYSIDSKAGTPSYISPQRFQGDAISETSEIFSIGVTLHKALTNKFPYGEIEPFQNPSFKQIKSIRKLNNKIPPWLDSVISRSLAVEEQNRYKNYSNMMYELEHTQKVQPYFNKNAPLLEKNPLMVYKVGFYLMLILNIIMFITFSK